MALKGKWIDKVDGVDLNSAEDINEVAHAVIELEEKGSEGIPQETDPTVPNWAKQEKKPTYTAKDVGAATEEQFAELSKAIADYQTLTLGVHTDGLVYIFKNGVPVGVGVKPGSDGDVIGYVDASNRIVIKGNLADGEYTVSYEMADGTEVEIGDLILGAEVVVYDNLVPTAINLDGTLMGTNGYVTGKRWSSSNVLKDEASATAVGLMPMATPRQKLTIYIYGLNFTGTTSDLVFACNTPSNGAVSNGGYFSNLLKDGFTGTNYVESVEKLADYYYKITTIAVTSTYNYFGVSGGTVSGIAPIVTIDQPIFAG